MSARATFAAWEHIARNKFTSPTRLVLLTLAHRHNQETGRCDPSIDRLCEDTGLSARAVRYALRALEKAKVIVTIERLARTGRGKRNLTNRYKIRGAPSAGGGVHDVHTNMKDRHTAPSAYDDLAMILDDVEDAATAGFAEKKGGVK